MVDLLVEIGTEEIPARFIEEAKASLLGLLKDAFERERVIYSGIKILATPRRFAILVFNMEPKQREAVEIRYGPPVHVALDEGGAPGKAAYAFAKSHGVCVDELRVFERDGKRFLGVEIRKEGKHVTEILPEILKTVLLKIPFPKKMRWGAGIEFARPIRWVLALLDGTFLRFSIGDIESSNYTFGHRLLSKGKIFVEDVREYEDALRQACVIVDELERLRMIQEGIRRIEEETKARALYDEALLKEILYITEYPFAILGSFEEGFLSLPKDVIMNVMHTHQRYIPLEKDGELLPHFICFANTVPRDEALVRRGNEKVLKARLEDARFYFEEDQKVRLETLYERLDGVVFHFRLGTMKEKVDRIRKVAGFLAERLCYSHSERLERAIRLMKADLLTHMVQEFPELQGKMGRIYAGLQGEEEEVAVAIEEHYLPSSKQEGIPKTTLGTILSIADKVDTLCAFFSGGILPSSDKDPYGLRRQAVGLIRILLESGLYVSLESLLDVGIEAVGGPREVKGELLEFIKGRIRSYLLEEGKRRDLVDAILPYAQLDPYDGLKRLEALESMVPVFGDVLVGFKRVYNMTKGLGRAEEVDERLFEFEEERALFHLLKEREGEYMKLLSERYFRSALLMLLEYKLPIDRFFEKVFVMVEDEAVRKNRLNLLQRVRDMFLALADFSKIEMEGDGK